MINLENLEQYIVINHKGLFYNGYKPHKKYKNTYKSGWTHDVNWTPIYTKIGPARNIVTFFTINWPSFKPPNIVKLSCSGNILNETKRINDAVEKIKQKKTKLFEF